MTEAEILSALSGFPVALIGDTLDRVPGARRLKPFHRSGTTMIGRALTVRTRVGDNLFIHRALDQVTPGCVIVVDGEGYADRALIGEIMVAIAASRGAAGFVIDGAIRDAGTIGQGGFPVYATAVSHRGPYKSGPGAVDVAVSAGGMIIGPGDIVMGDEDGVIAIPWASASSVIEAARVRQADEEAILRSIAENRYTAAYAG